MNLNNLPNSKEECQAWVEEIRLRNEKLFLQLSNENSKVTAKLHEYEKMANALSWDPRLRIWYISDQMVEFFNVRAVLPMKNQ